jgi:uncharacterized lipoprotein YajG
VTSFEIERDRVTKVMMNHLESKGWFIVQARDNADAIQKEIKPDILLSAKVVDLSIDIHTTFIRNEVLTKSKIAINAYNANDESTVRMTLNGRGSQVLFWFHPDDAKDLLEDVLKESFERLVKDTRFVNRTIRLS